jgi:flagellar hook-length control protein FliK
MDLSTLQMIEQMTPPGPSSPPIREDEPARVSFAVHLTPLIGCSAEAEQTPSDFQSFPTEPQKDDRTAPCPAEGGRLEKTPGGNADDSCLDAAARESVPAPGPLPGSSLRQSVAEPEPEPESEGAAVQPQATIVPCAPPEIGETKTVPDAPRADAKTVPDAPQAETKTVPGAPQAEAQTVPGAPRAETKTVPGAPRAETKTVPDAPRAETKTVPDAPQVETKTVPGAPQADTKTVPDAPQVEAKTAGPRGPEKFRGPSPLGAGEQRVSPAGRAWSFTEPEPTQRVSPETARSFVEYVGVSRPIPWAEPALGSRPGAGEAAVKLPGPAAQIESDRGPVAAAAANAEASGGGKEDSTAPARPEGMVHFTMPGGEPSSALNTHSASGFAPIVNVASGPTPVALPVPSRPEVPGSWFFAENGQRLDRVVAEVVERATLLRTQQAVTLDVQLKPEFLGKVRIEAVLRPDDGLTAVVTVQDQKVKSFLQSELPGLLAHLEKAGMKLEFLCQEQPDASAHHQAGYRKRHGQEQHWPGDREGGVARPKGLDSRTTVNFNDGRIHYFA